MTILPQDEQGLLDRLTEHPFEPSDAWLRSHEVPDQPETLLASVMGHQLFVRWTSDRHRAAVLVLLERQLRCRPTTDRRIEVAREQRTGHAQLLAMALIGFGVGMLLRWLVAL